MGMLIKGVKAGSVRSKMVNFEIKLSKFGEDCNIREMKKDIKKVLQRANRRIQNVEKAGLPSPALKALYAERGRSVSYSKFSISGLDLRNEVGFMRAKEEYARAVSFLYNPTSSATGAREYVKSIATKYNIPVDVSARIIDKATSPAVTDSGDINIFNYQSIVNEASNDVMNADLQLTEDTVKNGEIIESKIDETIARLNKNNMAHMFYDLFGDGSPRMK